MTRPAASSESLSLWIDTTPSTSYPSLRGELTADVAIVGGGITGITAAYLLAKAGKSVVIVEKGRIAMAETGHTTAHIIEATDADYRDLIEDHGEDNARLNTEAIRSSIALIRSVVDELHIDCGFKAVDGYLYTEDEEDREYLQRQQEFLRQAGIETEWVDQVPLPFPTKGGVHYRNQYVFHVRQYLLAVAEAAVKHGARIFESSLVNEVENAEKDGSCVAKTEEGSVRAQHLLLATHVPINDRGTLWAKMYMTRTYVVAAPIEPGQVTDALFWDTAYPYHYTRLLETNKGWFLVVGGEDRDVGKDGNDESRYEALEEYCRSRFGVSTFTHRWSGQINEPADALPFIGESSHGKNVWMSTGYSGTGMTYGTLSAMLLSDFAQERENRYAKLYDPGRTKVGAVLENVVTKAIEYPKRMIEKATHLDVEAKSVDEVGEGEGKIVSSGGEKYAAARIDGELRLLDPTCTHMGCTIAWNAAEKSWDCPCHGSRFDTRGQVLNGPATSPLALPAK
ncbi:MAG TPA: FAD-dependent oxidoreductase [Thermoanaerobaculia bacterium]|jgi:glycine/D-amino acid oxidase-like deaminating enzyme/nitrite reductase/ring-hydroxylating ferredoxin subunit|nr:FAD-dependent oxidoreductase [Thermoanaerobaculia bacterium]